MCLTAVTKLSQRVTLKRFKLSALVVRNSIDTIDTVSIPFGIVEYR